MLKRYFAEAKEKGKVPTTLWNDLKTTTDATKLLQHIFGLDYKMLINALKPKPNELIERIILLTTNEEDVTLDYFAGSGTTGHAVINLNREDGGERKYILVEMGEYFDSVLKPRLLKVIYSADWRDGKPVGRKGSSHMLKYLRLESYEDTLNNLQLQRSAIQTSLLDEHRDFRRDYMLQYLLPSESRASLLNVGHFDSPHGYTLQIGNGSAGATQPVAVDLVETFNYLLGLRVRGRDEQRGYVRVTGTLPSGERVLVIWRDLAQHDNAALNEFFRERSAECDLVYINGDNTLANLRRPDETWNVRLIEAEFMRLMFGE